MGIILPKSGDQRSTKGKDNGQDTEFSFDPWVVNAGLNSCIFGNSNPIFSMAKVYKPRIVFVVIHEI